MRAYSLLIFLFLQQEFQAQCKFRWDESNWVCIWHYLDIYDLPNEQQIAVLGVQSPWPDNGCNVLRFEKYEYCNMRFINHGSFTKESIVQFTDSEFTGTANFKDFKELDFSRIGYNITNMNEKAYYMSLGVDSLGGKARTNNHLLVANKNGEIILQKTYERTSMNGNVQYLLALKDDRLLAITNQIFGSENNYTAYWLSSINGEIIKSVNFNLSRNVGLYYLIESNDGQFLFTAKDPNHNDTNSILALKIDTTGNVLWSYESFINARSARDIFLNDSSIIICALTNDSQIDRNDLMLVELNQSGKEFKKHIVQIPDYTFSEYNLSMIKAKNGGYLVAANLAPVKGGEVNSSPINMSVISIDKEFHLNWYKYLNDRSFVRSFGIKLIECSDGGIAIIGRFQYKNSQLPGAIIQKFNHEIKVDVDNNEINHNSILNTNPVLDYINLNDQYSDYLQYSIFSNQGKLLQQGDLVSNYIDIMNLTGGVYWLQLQTLSHKIVYTKFIKL